MRFLRPRANAGCLPAIVAITIGGLVLGATTSAHAAASTAGSVQAGLVRLGYLPAGAVSGRMDERTRQAVLAFQGWEGLRRDGIADAPTLARLATATRPEPLRPRRSAIEVHVDRQVALLVRYGRVVRVIHISTGALGTPTPVGRFRVYRKERTSWSVPFRVWLPWASYFTGGVAFHGYPEVPAYPASHGCVRIPLSEAATVYAFARLGLPVSVIS